MDEVTDIAGAEEKNRLVSVARLGDTLTLAQDLVDAYSKLMDLAGSTKVEDGEWFETVAALAHGVRYQLVIGALAVLRAHLTDSYQSIRRAVELAAVAQRITGAPELRELWARYNVDEATFKRYRQAFATKHLFPKSDPLLRRLYERYDYGSKALHGSIMSLARRISVRAEGESRVVRGDYFEITDGNTAEPQQSFMYLIDSHFGILRVFTRILESQLGDLKGQWELEMKAINEKFAVHLQRWRPTFRS